MTSFESVRDALFEADRGLTGPGGPFETVQDLVLGERMLVFQDRLGSLREILAAASRFGSRDCLVFDDGRTRHVRGAPVPGRLRGHLPPRCPWRAQGRSCCDLRAQRSRLGAAAVGDGVARCGRRRHERLVERARDGQRLGPHRADGRLRRWQAWHAPDAALRRPRCRPCCHDRSLVRCVAPGHPDCRRRSCGALLHQRYDRAAEGSVLVAPGLGGVQRAAGVHRCTGGSARGLEASSARPPTRLAVFPCSTSPVSDRPSRPSTPVRPPCGHWVASTQVR